MLTLTRPTSAPVLDKSSARAFPHIFNRAQAILRSTFCYELAPIRAKGVENEQLAAQAREALKKQKSQQREREAASTQGKGKGKAKETHKAANEEEDDEEEEGGSRGALRRPASEDDVVLDTHSLTHSSPQDQ